MSAKGANRFRGQISPVFLPLGGGFYLVYCENSQFIGTPTLKEAKGLFVTRHGFFTELGAAAINHKFIDLPVKIQTFHRKNTPVHWGNFYPIKQECSLAQQKTFIGSKVSVHREQPKYSLASLPIRTFKKLKKHGVSLEIRNF